MTAENGRKKQIVEVAAILFKEKGYSAVTMRDIAQALGIKAASLYNHIRSKQELLVYLIMSLAEEFTLGMERVLVMEGSVIEKLEEIIKLHVEITAKDPNGMSALNSDWMHLEEELDSYLMMRYAYEESFRKILEAGIEKEELYDVNVEVMLFSILSTLRSLYLWLPKKESVNMSELSSDLVQVLLKGVAK